MAMPNFGGMVIAIIMMLVVPALNCTAGEWKLWEMETNASRRTRDGDQNDGIKKNVRHRTDASTPKSRY